MSGEGESFDVPLSVARMSEVVKTMITEDPDDDETQEIPLPNVKSTILGKVIEFAKHYKEEPMTEIEKVKFHYFYISDFPLLTNMNKLRVFTQVSVSN